MVGRAHTVADAAGAAAIGIADATGVARTTERSAIIAGLACFQTRLVASTVKKVQTVLAWSLTYAADLMRITALRPAGDAQHFAS